MAMLGRTQEEEHYAWVQKMADYYIDHPDKEPTNKEVIEAMGKKNRNKKVALDRTGTDEAGYYEFTGTPIELTRPYVAEEDDHARGLGPVTIPVTIGVGPTVRPLTNEEIAIQFHYTYEALAPSFGWETQKRSRTPWEDLPETNKQLMISTIAALLARGVIYR